MTLLVEGIFQAFLLVVLFSVIPIGFFWGFGYLAAKKKRPIKLFLALSQGISFFIVSSLLALAISETWFWVFGLLAGIFAVIGIYSWPPIILEKFEIYFNKLARINNQ
ncbi:MAG: hypothetical protein JNM55_12140 [Anaerolineales bacterium]|nr:hypothetical protein [Anaerolineales bacterium]